MTMEMMMCLIAWSLYFSISRDIQRKTRRR